MKNVLLVLRNALARSAFVLYLGGNAILHFLRKHLLLLALLVVALPLLVAGILWFGYMSPPANQMQEDLQMVIPRGATLVSIADSLVEKKAIRSPLMLRALGRITGKARQIKAGLVTIPSGSNALEVLEHLGDARVESVRVTIPEGVSAEAIASILQNKVGTDSAKFMDLVKDSTFAQKLAHVNTLEGFLLPETYQIDKDSEAEKMVRFLVNNTLKIFEPDSVRAQIDSLGFTRYEILTLAAIVEGEALLDRERADIASLYHNRLRKGWRLQADPTIQYAIPGPPRRLLYKDLEIDSPYNTYKYGGLPPGPINNPGRNSIIATIFPSTTPYLYMVAAGDGSHKFSTTLREHNYWHKRFNEVRRQVRRQQRQSGGN